MPSIICGLLAACRHPHAIIVCDEKATDELKHGTYKYIKDIEKDILL